jgi:hypothetical protein
MYVFMGGRHRSELSIIHETISSSDRTSGQTYHWCQRTCAPSEWSGCHHSPHPRSSLVPVILIVPIVPIVPSPHDPVKFCLAVHPLPQLVVRILYIFPALVDPTEKDTVLHLARLTRGLIHRQTISYRGHAEDPQVESRTLTLGLTARRNGGVDKATAIGRQMGYVSWYVLLPRPCHADEDVNVSGVRAPEPGYSTTPTSPALSYRTRVRCRKVG